LFGSALIVIARVAPLRRRSRPRRRAELSIDPAG